MALFMELFNSLIGILSIFTIVFIIAMAGYLVWWMKKQAKKDAEDQEAH